LKEEVQFALCGEVASEDSMDLSYDGLWNDCMISISSGQSNSPSCLHQQSIIFSPLVVRQQIIRLQKTCNILKSETSR